MPELDPDKIRATLALLGPGLVILWVRSRFVGYTSSQKLSDNVLAYVAVSAAYFGTVSPALKVAKVRLDLSDWASSFIEFGIGPALVGLLLGALTQKEVAGPLLNRLGLNPTHGIPTAWDWTFYNKRKGSWVLVTLTDGAEIAGWFGGDSFASTELTQRDLFIEAVHDRDESGGFREMVEPRGILIRSEQIRYVEFYPETDYGQKTGARGASSGDSWSPTGEEAGG